MQKHDEDKDYTIDAFYKGKFYLAQPISKGHRSGIDAILVSAMVPMNFCGELVDLGAGAGAIGFAVAARASKAKVTLIEKSGFMLEYAKRSLMLPENQSIAANITIKQFDICASAKQRSEAAIKPNFFDYVIFNPPFNHVTDRATHDQEKAIAHVMSDNMFEAWIKMAAAIIKPKGHLALIARPSSLAEILQALNRRFGNIKIIPIHPRANKAAIRIIIYATAGSKAALQIYPPLILHDDTQSAFSRQVREILDGETDIWQVLAISI